MKIKYEYVTGESVEIEVPEGIGEVSIELDRAIYNSDHRETRRHNSVETMQEQGVQLSDKRVDVSSAIEKQEMTDTLNNALDKLLPQQRELIRKVFIEGMSVSSIAREEGVNEGAIRNRLRKIYKRVKTILL